MITINKDIHDELVGLIEDSVEHFCDENMVSGELTWIIVQTLAEAKIAQMKGTVK